MKLESNDFNITMQGGDTNLHNVGAPMSRHIKQQLVQTMDGIQNNASYLRANCWFIPARPAGKNLIPWLEELAESCGFRSLNDALASMPVPKHQGIVLIRSDESLRHSHQSANSTLHHAAVLTRIGNCYYDPERPPVISERRLIRILELTEISNEDFYELD